MTRRVFQHLGVLLFPLTIGGGALAAAFRYLTPYPGKRRKPRLEVGHIDDLKAGAVRKVNFNHRLVYVLWDGAEVRAFDAECTHLACNVAWHPKGHTYATCQIRDKDHFHCPCHGARFERDGRVACKPAPRPLREFVIADLAQTDGKVVVLDQKKS